MSSYVVTQEPVGTDPHWIVTTTTVGPKEPGMEFMLKEKGQAEALAMLLNTRASYKWIAEVDDLDSEAMFETNKRINGLKIEWKEMGIELTAYAPVGHGILNTRDDV